MKQLIIVESQTSLLFWKQSSSSSLLFSLSLSLLSLRYGFLLILQSSLRGDCVGSWKKDNGKAFSSYWFGRKKYAIFTLLVPKFLWGGLRGNRVTIGLWGLSKASLAISYNSLFEKKEISTEQKKNNFFDVLGKLETNWVSPETYKIGQVPREIFKQSF